jgi:hypothetical protein
MSAPALRAVLRAAAIVAALSAALASPASGQTPASAPLDDAGYWAIADAGLKRLDRFWNESAGVYRPGGGGGDPMVNGLLLVAHSVAARRGLDESHAIRNDHRARLIARRLVSGPPWVESGAPAGAQRHTPGWVNSLDSVKHSGQHLVFDAEVAEGLAAAWQARKELDLPEETVRLIVDRIHRTAAGRFYRWPAIRLNQVNWYAGMYAAAATVAGDDHLLRRDLKLQLERFVSGIGDHAGTAGNLGPGGRFHYLPGQRVAHPVNVDSAEYANIVVGLTRNLDQARAAGMRLSLRTRATLRDWSTRTLGAYWTHGGYLNWDTGLGFERWHQSKKLGLTQAALLGIASDRTLGIPGDTRHWAKWMLDSGLLFFERQAEIQGGIPNGVFFGVHKVPQGEPAARLGASRIVANAARAVAAGLGTAAADEPPALYAYDADIGRLAVTTPTYNTAIVAVNQGGFPYGGIDLARLFDSRQEVAGNIGGHPPASFGLEVRDRAGRRLLATQSGRKGRAGASGLRLTRSGMTVHASSSRLGVLRTGRFKDLRVAGVAVGGGFVARTAHRFTSRFIESTWTAGAQQSRGRTATVTARFPSTGGNAGVEAVMRDGSVVTLGSKQISLRHVRAFRVRSSRSGYEVRILSAPSGAVASASRPAAQPDAPKPGPSLVVRLAGGRITAVRLSVRITVDSSLGKDGA